MDLKQQAKNVAAQGRFGDSMLLHVNPAEMKGIASSMPITINPETGQPEAFLPFLAPILGSLGFSALAGTGALGATLAAKPLLASAIGSGLAQTAVTGDLKKGILAGITGYGVGSALQGAGAAAQGAQASEAATQAITDAATDAATSSALLDANLVNPSIAGPVMPGAAGVGLNQAGIDAVNRATNQALATGQPAITQAAKTGFGDVIGSEAYLASNPTLGQAFQDAGGFSLEGGKNLLTGLSQPSSYLPIAGGMGTTGVMMSQEAFEEQLKQMGIDAEERKRRIREMYPENIPVASGGPLSFQDGGITFNERFVPPVANPFRMNTQAIQRVPNPIDPNFMPGFQPEFNYFQNLNPSATAIEGGAQGIMAVNQPSVGPFNPTATPEYNQFYSAALGAAPQVLNPFAPITPFTPIPPSIPTTPPDDGRGDRDDTPPPPPPDDMPPPKPPIDIPIDGPLIPPIGKGGPGTKPPSIDRIDDFVDLPTPLVPPMDGPVIPNIPVIPTGGDFSIQRDDIGMRQIDDIGMRPPSIGGVGGINQDDFIPMQPPVITPPVDTPILPPMTPLERPIITPPPLEDFGFGPGIRRSEDFFRPEDLMMPPAPMVQSEPTPVMAPTVPFVQPNIPLINPAILPSPVNTIPRMPIMSPPMRMAEGESTEVQVDKLPEGLKAMYDSGPKGREGVEKIAAKTDKFQEGRSTSIMQDEVTMELVKFLRGETDDDSIIAKFLEKYGNEAFMQVRQAVLQNIIPGSQTQGMIQGNNRGGMDDDINGLIGATQPVAVSQDEYIIPADVVSDLGDGSSDAGAKKLDQLLNRVRMAKTGTTKQASPIKDNEVMPA
jgi:hypothetical protein